MSKMKQWREAATLILVMRQLGALQSESSAQGTSTGNQSGDYNASEDYRVLMLKRSHSSSFRPSFMVFPGGTLSNADHSKDWYSLLYQMTKKSPEETLKRLFSVEGPRVPMISENRPAWQGVSADFAFRICAIRETFEESGVLLVLSKEGLSTVLDVGNRKPLTLKQWIDPEQLQLDRWKKLVHADADAFLKMCTELEVFPNIWALHEWSNWLTPVFWYMEKRAIKPMRFDTMFYIACFECDSLPAVSEDGTETVQYQWKRPSEYVSDRTFLLDVPQNYELKRLLNFSSLDRLLAFSADRAPKGLERFMPVIQPCEDGFISYLPGDWCYPANPDYEGERESETATTQLSCLSIDETKAMHRFILHLRLGIKRGIILCNRSPPYGHIGPIESKPIVAFNSTTQISSKI